MSEQNPIDCEVAVVGAGVAGLAAAVRLRRPEVVGVRSATVAVFEGGRTGGLLAWKSWRGYHLTGPRYRFRREDWDGIQEDARTLSIPILDETVTSMDLSQPVKVVVTDARKVRCHAVVLAPGIRPLRNAGDFDREGGVITAFGTAEHARHAILSHLRSRGGGRPLLWGRETIQDLGSMLAELTPEVVIEPPYLNLAPAGNARRGMVLRLLGEDRVRGVEYRDLDGRHHTVACDCVFVDFNGYMAATHTTRFLEGTGLLLKNGFVVTNEDLATNVDGVFAAGDVTGGMFAVSKALYQGVRAGFSALRFLHRSRFGEEPGLYPFFHAARDVDVTVFHRVAGVSLTLRSQADTVVVEVRSNAGSGRALVFPGATEPLCAWIAAGSERFDIRDAIEAARDLTPADIDRVLVRLVEAGALGFGRPARVSEELRP